MDTNISYKYGSLNIEVAIDIVQSAPLIENYIHLECVDHKGSNIATPESITGSTCIFILPQNFNILLGFLILRINNLEYVVNSNVLFHENQCSNIDFIKRWISTTRPEMKIENVRYHMLKSLLDIVCFGGEVYFLVAIELIKEILINKNQKSITAKKILTDCIIISKHMETLENMKLMETYRQFVDECLKLSRDFQFNKMTFSLKTI